MKRWTYYHNPYHYNPDSWETSVRKLLMQMTGEAWRVGQDPPVKWHRPYLSSRPEWSPIWLVATSLKTAPEELLARIKPGKRRVRDIDELNIFYAFIKDHLADHGNIRGKDVAALAQNLGLSTLSGNDTDCARERTLILKQLVRDGYAKQVMGRYRGSSHYISTTKLINEITEQRRTAPPRDVSSATHAALPIGPMIGPVIPSASPPAPEDAVIGSSMYSEEQDDFMGPRTPVDATQDLLENIEQFEGIKVLPTKQWGIDVVEVPEGFEETKKRPPKKRPKQKGVSKGGDALKQIMQLVRKHSAKQRRLKKHVLLTFPGKNKGDAGKSFTIPGTPSDHRSLKNSLAEIRRYLRSVGLADRRNPHRRLCAYHRHYNY